MGQKSPAFLISTDCSWTTANRLQLWQRAQSGSTWMKKGEQLCWHWGESVDSPVAAEQVLSEGDTKLDGQTHRDPDQQGTDRTTTQLQPGWGNNQGHRPEPEDSSWIKGEAQQDSQLFPQQSESGLSGCTIPKMNLSTAGGQGVSGQDTSYPTSTYCSFFCWCWRYQCQHWQSINFWRSYFPFIRL